MTELITYEPTDWEVFFGFYTPETQLWGGKWCELPRSVRLCPECGHSLYVNCDSWDTDTGQPFEVSVDCKNEKWFDDEEPDSEELPGFVHRYWQSDWQSVRDEVEAWAKVAPY